MNCLIPITNTFSDIRRALPVLSSLNELIEMLSNHKYDISKMVPSILDLVSSYPFSIKSFPLIEKGYSRTILHREPNGFEVMVARWSRHAKTPIHGHPGFSVLYLIEGELSEQSFIKEKSSLKNKRSTLSSQEIKSLSRTAPNNAPKASQ